MVPGVGCEVKRGIFKIGEITVCMYVDGNDTATVYKTLSLAESVSLTLILEKDGKCNTYFNVLIISYNSIVNPLFISC